MDNKHFPEENPDEPKMDALFNQSDLWLEQLEYIGSLMDMPESFPAGWETTMQEPDAEFMAVSDANADVLLHSLRG